MYDTVKKRRPNKPTYSNSNKNQINKKTKHKKPYNTSNKNQSVTQSAWKSGVGILEFASF